jgi:hypothetical protein
VRSASNWHGIRMVPELLQLVEVGRWPRLVVDHRKLPAVSQDVPYASDRNAAYQHVT